MSRKKVAKKEPVVHKHPNYLKTLSGTEKEIIDLIFIFNLVGTICDIEDYRGMRFTGLKIAGFEAPTIKINVGDESQKCHIPVRLISECGRNFLLCNIRNINVVEKAE